MASSIIAREALARTLPCASASPDARDDISSWFRDFHRPLIKVLASKRVVPSSHLDDLVQETFLRAWRYSNFESVQNVLGYLITIAMNLASEWKQLSANRNPHLSDSVLEHQPCDDSESPDTKAELVDRNRCVRAALDTLPCRRRSVHILQCRDDLSYSQIAKRLGVTTRVVNREINVGHRELRLALARVGLEPCSKRSARQAYRRRK